MNNMSNINFGSTRVIKKAPEDSDMHVKSYDKDLRNYLQNLGFTVKVNRRAFSTRNDDRTQYFIDDFKTNGADVIYDPYPPVDKKDISLVARGLKDTDDFYGKDSKTDKRLFNAILDYYSNSKFDIEYTHVDDMPHIDIEA